MEVQPESQKAALDGFLDSSISWVKGAVPKLIMIIVVIVAFILLYKLFMRVARRLGKRAVERNTRITPHKLDTLGSLGRTFIRIAFIILAAMIIFDICGLSGAVAGVLTTAGIGSILIALGVQNTVKDFCAGIILTIEDQIAIGDYVEVNGQIGTVEAMTIRTVRIRTYGGQLVMIPAGSISTVVNWSRGNTRAIIDVLVPRTVPTEKLTSALKEVCDGWAAERTDIVLEAPRVLGITMADAANVTYRIAGKVKEISCWEAELELRASLKERLDRDGIVAGFPKTAVHGNSEVLGNGV